MAKKAAGEVSLKTGRRTVTLRLTVGGIMALEDHYDASIFDLMEKRYAKSPPRVGDLAVLYAVMQGGDPADRDGVERAAADFAATGFDKVAAAVVECLVSTLLPKEAATTAAESAAGKQQAAPAAGKTPARTARQRR